VLDVTNAKRLDKLIRLLSSDSAGEVAATVGAIKRTLGTCGLDFHALADRLTSKPDKPKPGGVTQADLERIRQAAYRNGHKAGYEAGKCSVAASNQADLEKVRREAYYNGYEAGKRAPVADSTTTPDDDVGWKEMARWCRERFKWLNDRERDFVQSMVLWTATGREPTEKQAAWLDDIFDQLKEREDRHDRRRRSA
jgi:hypothetical protein